MMRRTAATTLAMLALATVACDEASTPVGPIDSGLMPSLLATIPTVTVRDLWVCAEGPAGTYNFDASTLSGVVTYEEPPVAIASGDSTFSLNADQCALVAKTFQQSQVQITLVSGPAQSSFVQTQVYAYSLRGGGGDIGDAAPLGPPGTSMSQIIPLNGDQGTVIVFTSTETPTTIGEGRMTGGGWQEDVGGFDKVSHSFTIHCDNELSNNIEINWPGNKFHIKKESLTNISCIDDPAFDHEQPDAPFNTFIGDAEGKLNNVAGGTIHFTFIDDGEPGKDADLAGFTIRNAGGHVVLDVPLGTVDGGNIQAHFDQPHGQHP